MNQHENYETQSLALAAAIQLVSKDKLLRIDRSSHRASFVFPDTNELQQIISKFWQSELLVDALGYFEAIRHIKAILYERNSSL